MQATPVTTCRLQAPSRRAVLAHRPRQPALRAATRRSSVRVHAFVSDVAKYLSEAASQIFHLKSDSVPWEKSSQAFTGKIVHHEEAARLQALKAAVDRAVLEIERSIDESEAEDEPLASASASSVDEAGTGAFVMTSIQRVFGNNFKGDATEPKDWASAGYAAPGRFRSQRDLRKEWERLQRFQSVVDRVLEEARRAKREEAGRRDI